MNDERKTNPMKEDMLVILAREGQPDAFRSLYDLHWRRIYAIAFRHTRSQPDAEDIMQETFIKAFKRIRSFRFDRGAGFAPWLNAICLHSTIDFLRRQKRRHRDHQVSLADLNRELRSSGPSPEESAVHSQAAGSIRQALRVLSPRQKLIFEMRYLQHMDIREIAENLKCSPSNVKTQISRSLAKLRKILEPVWGML